MSTSVKNQSLTKCRMNVEGRKGRLAIPALLVDVVVVDCRRNGGGAAPFLLMTVRSFVLSLGCAFEEIWVGYFHHEVKSEAVSGARGRAHSISFENKQTVNALNILTL